MRPGEADRPLGQMQGKGQPKNEKQANQTRRDDPMRPAGLPVSCYSRLLPFDR